MQLMRVLAGAQPNCFLSTLAVVAQRATGRGLGLFGSILDVGCDDDDVADRSGFFVEAHVAELLELSSPAVVWKTWNVANFSELSCALEECGDYVLAAKHSSLKYRSDVIASQTSQHHAFAITKHASGALIIWDCTKDPRFPQFVSIIGELNCHDIIEFPAKIHCYDWSRVVGAYVRAPPGWYAAQKKKKILRIRASGERVLARKLSHFRNLLTEGKFDELVVESIFYVANSFRPIALRDSEVWSDPVRARLEKRVADVGKAISRIRLPLLRQLYIRDQCSRVERALMDVIEAERGFYSELNDTIVAE